MILRRKCFGIWGGGVKNTFINAFESKKDLRKKIKDAEDNLIRLNKESRNIVDEYESYIDRAKKDREYATKLAISKLNQGRDELIGDYNSHIKKQIDDQERDKSKLGSVDSSRRKLIRSGALIGLSAGLGYGMYKLTKNKKK